MKAPTEPIDPATQAEWADRIVALEPDVSAGVAAYALRMAADRRLPAADRQFAKSQAEAIRRALRRAKAKAKAKPATTKSARKPGKKS